MMWTAYKREIMEREKEESDYLKKLFDQHKEFHSKNGDDVAKAIPTISVKNQKKPEPDIAISKLTPEVEVRENEDDDWNVELVFLIY